jgi:hypothetical protein
MCRTQLVAEHEPFPADIYLLFAPNQRRAYFLDYGDPYSPIDRTCNILTALIGYPPICARVIRSQDDFRTLIGTSVLYESFGQQEFLEARGRDRPIDAMLAKSIVRGIDPIPWTG